MSTLRLSRTRRLRRISKLAYRDAQKGGEQNHDARASNRQSSGEQNKGGNKMYFAGSINPGFGNASASGRFAQSLVARFDAAVAGLDNLIIAWWDGSCKKRHGGSATIIDVCLPARPKFTLQFAKPTGSFGGNSVLMETYGALNACTIIKRILDHCQSENLLRDVAGNLEIILVTDCEPLLTIFKQLNKNSESAGRFEPILNKIKALSEDILGFKEASIKLDLYHCHRNQTTNLTRADQLAGRARGQHMSFQCASHHEDVGTRRPGDIVYYNNWERPNSTPSCQALETELQDALQRHPMTLNRKRARLSDATLPKTKKRKISHPQSMPGGTPLEPVRRSARLLAMTSGP